MATLVCTPQRLLVSRSTLWCSSSGVAYTLDVPAQTSRIFRLPSFSCRSALRWYSARLMSQPLTTKCVTGGVLFSLGDIAAQRIARGNQAGASDLKRTAEMSLWGGLFNCGMGHMWYNFVEVVATLPGALGIMQRIAYDQLFWTPCVDTAFFSYHALVNGRGLPGVREELSQKLWPTLAENWKVWPLVHCITYCFVPLHLRVLWVTAVGVCWSTFLSFMANDFKV